jgi:hypothetical protein
MMEESFDTIVCIYSSCAHLENAKKLRDSLSLPDSKFFIFLSKGYEGEEEDGIVKLDIDEGYELLSLKTYKMFKYIRDSGLKFKKIYKIDVPQGGEDIEDVEAKFFGNSVDIKDHYFGNDWYRASEKSTLSWFKAKGLSIKGGSWWILTDQMYIHYFSGKLYGLSKDFFDFFIDHDVTEGLCHLMVRDWGGCEDIVVGIIYEKFLDDQQ